MLNDLINILMSTGNNLYFKKLFKLLSNCNFFHYLIIIIIISVSLIVNIIIHKNLLILSTFT